MKDRPQNVETLEQAQARGVKITRCPSVPAKRPLETQKDYGKRVRAVIKTATEIDVNHIPEDLRYLVAEIKK